MNPLSDLVAGKAKATAPSRAALQAVASINQKLRQLRDDGVEKNRIAEKREKALLLASKMLLETIANERIRLFDILAARAKVWKTDAERKTAKRHLALDEAKTRYGAMSESELETELLRAVTTDTLTGNPNIVNALVAAAKNSGVDTIPYRQKLVERGYDRPWENDASGREIVRELKMYDGVEPGNLPIRVGDGQTTVALREMLDDLEAEDGNN